MIRETITGAIAITGLILAAAYIPLILAAALWFTFALIVLAEKKGQRP